MQIGYKIDRRIQIFKNRKIQRPTCENGLRKQYTQKTVFEGQGRNWRIEAQSWQTIIWLNQIQRTVWIESGEVSIKGVWC